MTGALERTIAHESGSGAAPSRGLIAFGVVLFVHGVAHVVGMTEAVGAIDDGTGVDVLGGLAELTDTASLVGWAVIWGLLAVGFAAAAVLSVFRHRAAAGLTGVLASASAFACVVGLWASVIGLGVNVAVLLGVSRVRRW